MTEQVEQAVKDVKNLYIVCHESKQYGWIIYLTTLTHANNLLKIDSNINYIFNYCHYYKQKPFYMKIRYPIGEFYDSVVLNNYREENFNDTDKYVIITRSEECDADCLILTHKSS